MTQMSGSILRKKLTPEERREAARLAAAGKNPDYIRGWLYAGRILYPDRVRDTSRTAVEATPMEAATMSDEVTTEVGQTEETDMTAKKTTKSTAKKKAAPPKKAAAKTVKKAAPKKTAEPKPVTEKKPRGSGPRANTMTALIVELTKDGKDHKAIGDAVAKAFPTTKFAEEVGEGDYHSVRWYQTQAMKRGWLTKEQVG